MNLTIHIPKDDGTVERLERHVKDPVTYLDRMTKTYPEGTVAIYSTGNGTIQFRRHHRDWRFERQTVGP